MARHYGGQTGEPNNPNSLQAPGSFVAPSEVYRQRALDTWPIVSSVLPVDSSIGTYAFALTSGVVEKAVTQGWIEPNGQILPVSTYPDLATLFSTQFGGDGVNTFGIPACTKDQYFKMSTGTTPVYASMSGQAVLPAHTHTYTHYRGLNSEPATFPGNQYPAGASGFDGVSDSAGGIYNRPKNKPAFPLLCVLDSFYPIGSVFPLVDPGSITGVPPAFYPSNNIIVCSGQSLNTVDTPLLFEAIGYTYGGSGSAFYLPDLRGLFIENSHVGTFAGEFEPASGYTADSFASHNHTLSGVFSFQPPLRTDFFPGGGGDNFFNGVTDSAGAGEATESRPKNFAVYWCTVAV